MSFIGGAQQRANAVYRQRRDGYAGAAFHVMMLLQHFCRAAIASADSVIHTIGL